MGIGTWQIIAILVIALLLFGGKKIPELAQGLGKGIKNFKDAVREGEENKETIQETKNISQTTVNKTEKKDINA